MLNKIVLMLFFISAVNISAQELPNSLFPNQKNYDLNTLLQSGDKIEFSDAEITNMMNLSNAISLALNNNLELEQSYRDFTSAKALHTGSIQDFWVPNLSTSFSASLSDTFGSSASPSLPSTGNGTGDGMYMNFILPSVSLSKTVFNGLGTWYAHRIAKENYLNAQNTYENKKRDVVFETTTRYYNQILKQEEVQVAFDRLKQLQSQLRQAEINYANGLASDLDVALTRSQFYSAQPAYFAAEKNRLFAQEDFARYIGLKEVSNTYLLLEGSLFDVKDVEFSRFDEQESLNYILTNDTMLAQLRSSYQNSKSQKGQQNAVRMPKVDLFFNYDPSYGETTDSFSNAAYKGSYAFGATLRVPILEWIPGTGAASQVKAANEIIKKAEFALLDAEEQKIVELKNTFLNIRELTQSVEALQVAEFQAQRALTIAQQQYRNGLISIIELNQTQVDYTDARRNLLNAIYQAFWAKLKLQASISTLPMFMEEIAKLDFETQDIEVTE